jgi:Icc-related predicted phosphoesterase
MNYAESCLNDHRMIRTGRHVFSARDALAEHERSRKWLAEELAKPFEGKTVVVTHHGPHPLSTHPRFAGNDLNPAFISDLSELLPGADLWVHGHVHDGADYQVGRCRVVANPAGYILNRRMAVTRTDFIFENKTFDAGLVVEI